MDQKQRFDYLFQQYASRQHTPAEKQELMEFIDSGIYDEQLKMLVGDQWLKGAVGDYENQRAEELYEKIMDRVKVKKMRPWLKYVAAAAVLVFLFGGYWLFTGKKVTNGPGQTNIVKIDVEAPKVTKATITLASGKQIVLDSAGNGLLAVQKNVQLVKLADGQIAYNGNGTTNTSIEYNTLSNPRGSKVINLTLSDGSKVWLNAESSLRYPTAFTGAVRKVEITGEAYFEIAHDANKPFKVTRGETEVTVLGTHFNVNAYDDEEALKVTLLEGSVKVSQGNSNQTLSPGEQAQVTSQKQIYLDKAPDLDQVMAWKNGLFNFNKTDIGTIMRQVQRWY
ncbi:MAG: FecR family protein, partial [Ginsengibacter sp.]